MKEHTIISCWRYLDKDNNPTCAVDFSTGEICEFLRCQRFGTWETCLFAPTENRGFGYPLKRRGKGKKRELGTLIPGDWCPLFKEEEEEKGTKRIIDRIKKGEI